MRRRSLLLAPAALAVALALGAGGCYHQGDYSPTASLVDSIIALVSVDGRTSLPADGFSRLRLEARLLGEPAFADRTVLFRTTAGTLEGGTADGDAMAVEADGAGRARIDLVSVQQALTAVVTATPKGAPGATASLEIAFTAATPGDVIHFVAAPATAPADGATLTTFTVEISAALPASQRSVTFTTTSAAGFAPGGATSVSVGADGSNRASADLKSPAAIGSARVAATVNQVTQEVGVSFTRALPEDIVVSADPVAVAATPDASVAITATLLRDVGAVTPGTVVTFRAEDDAGAAVGSFVNATRSGADGSATATFQPRSTTPGFVTVIVGVDGSGVTGSVRIELTAP
jgi:hypothetical protein